MKRCCPLLLRLKPHIGSTVNDATVPLSRVAEALSNVRTPVAIISSFDDVYHNLSVEEYLSRTVSFSPVEGRDGPHVPMLLFTYIDQPSVVIGRNQSLYREACVPLCRARGVPMARRTSGGGTVYHDFGNVNFCFLTHRNSYHPLGTIAILMRFLISYFDISPTRLTMTKRHDIFLDMKKLSGSAMRLHKHVAFHHCTLLVSSEIESLGACLRPSGTYCEFQTRATSSVRSPVTSLAAAGLLSDGAATESLTTDAARLRAAEAIQREFARYFCDHARDDYLTAAISQSAVTSDEVGHQQIYWTTKSNDHAAGASSSSHIITLTDEVNEDVRAEVAQLRSTEWLASKDPRFTTTVTFPLAEVVQSSCASLERVLVLLVDPDIRSALPVASSLHPGGKNDGGIHSADFVVVCETKVDEGKLVSLQWTLTEQSGDALDPRISHPLPWLSRYLSAVLHGERMIMLTEEAIGAKFPQDNGALSEEIVRAACDELTSSWSGSLIEGREGCDARPILRSVILALVRRWFTCNGWA